MVVWIVILWLGASLMACWSFSLFVRLVSELFARRRKRLIAQRSRRSLWVGFGLTVVCAVVAVVFGYLAYTNAANYPETERYAAPVYAISGSLVLFGLMMFVGASIGDRPRGRVRCPKCWYDMSAASGLQCPECGRTAKSIRQFSKAKRRKWAFVLGLLLIGTGAYGVSVSRRVVETDWLAAVPSWFLMAGWEWLPEDWILAENSAYESPLQNRIYPDRSWSKEGRLKVSESRARRFGRRLCQPLLTNQAERGNFTRLMLIAFIGDYLTYEDGTWIGPPIDARQLYRLSVEDIIDVMDGDGPAASELGMFDKDEKAIDSWYAYLPYTVSLWWITEELNIQREESSGSTKKIERDSPEVYAELAPLLGPIHDRILSDSFIEYLIDPSTNATQCALHIAKDAGLLDQVQHVYLNPEEVQGQLSADDRAFTIGYNWSYEADPGLNQFYESLEALICSDQEHDLAHGLKILLYIAEYHQPNELNVSSKYNRIVSLAVDAALGWRKSIPNQPASQSWTYDSAGMVLLMYQDVDGDQLFPLIAEDLVVTNGANPMSTSYYGRYRDGAFIKAWVENFAPLAKSNSISVRRWVIDNLPTIRGTPFDQELDQIGLDMLHDRDKRITQFARHKLRSREVDIPSKD